MVTRELRSRQVEDSAPSHVRLVQDFVNTFEPQTRDESLQSPADVRDWFVTRGLAPAGRRPTTRDLELARAVREGLRAVLMGHTPHATDDAAITALNEALRDVAMNVEFDDEGDHRLVAANPTPIHVGLTGIVEAIRAATEDQSWNRLKVCARDTCRWAFYDTSRNRAGRWCSMAGCGTHIKNQRAYAARKSRVGIGRTRPRS